MLDFSSAGWLLCGRPCAEHLFAVWRGKEPKAKQNTADREARLQKQNPGLIRTSARPVRKGDSKRRERQRNGPRMEGA